MVDRHVILDSMHQAMQKNPVFGSLLSVDDRQYLLSQGSIRAVKPGEILCKQYQRDTNVYMLINGVVEVSEEVQSGVISLGKLHSGEVFGEIGALFMMPRIATVTVVKPSVVLEIPGEVLAEMMERVPVLREAISERYRDRTIKTALKSVEIFSSLPDDAMHAMADAASIVTAKKDEQLIKEGEPGDAMYIINYGVARVYTESNGSELNLALLRGGNYFGEWSLLKDSPRAASVAAVTQMEMVRLGREEFLDFIKKYPDARKNIDLEAQERKNRTEFARNVPESSHDVQTILSEIERILVAEHEANVEHL